MAAAGVQSELILRCIGENKDDPALGVKAELMKVYGVGASLPLVSTRPLTCRAARVPRCYGSLQRRNPLA